MKYKPALDFDSKYGTSVGKNYKIHKNYNPKTLEDILVKHIKKIDSMDYNDIHRVAMNIITLNPELRPIFDDSSAESICDFLMGVLSGLNPTDINYFETIHSKKTYREMIEFMNYITNLLKKYNVVINWIPAPETLKTIVQHLESTRNPINEEISHIKKLIKI